MTLGRKRGAKYPHPLSMNLSAGVMRRLNRLSAETGIARAVLAREGLERGIDGLIKLHGKRKGSTAEGVDAVAAGEGEQS